jgi:hypothetical protein
MAANRCRYKHVNAHICTFSPRDVAGEKTLTLSQGFKNVISLLTGNIWMDRYRCDALYKSFGVRAHFLKKGLEEWTVIYHIISITRNI